ncbi:MAG TPA: hypothetical protein VKG86_13230 [Terracidiphilus sp.]|nr:hypothetical protein [Terracidiphilus sp.]
MSHSGQYDSRLSELIWRSVKLRISILLLCIFALLTTWSSLEVGNRKAQEVGKSYCLKIADNLQQLMLLKIRDSGQQHPSLSAPEYTVVGASDFCAGIQDTHYWIQYQQAFPEFSLLYPKEPEEERKLETAIRRALSDYEEKRNEAFRIDLKLAAEYSENNIEANALSVAAVVPFIVLGLLVLYFMLGHQEAGWARQLRLELDQLESDEKASPDLFAAKSQYFVSPRDRVGGFWLLGFLVSPDKFAKTVLVFSTLYLLCRATAEFADELSSVTDSIFEGYSFWLYTAAFSAFVIVAFSHRYCSATESRRSSDHLIIFPNARTDGFVPSIGFRRFVHLIRRPIVFIFIVAAFLSLAVPWAYRDFGGAISGYEWLLRHDQGNHWIGAAGQAMDLSIFREVRLEILIALLFLALCMLCEIKPSWGEPRLSKILRRIRNLAAVIVLFLSIDYLIFMEILEGERLDVLHMLQESQGSMIFYNPAFGYWIFTALCVALSALSLSGLEVDS